MYTTLNRIRERKPCEDGWEKLLRYLGKTKSDDEPLSLLTILDANGFSDTVWCTRAVTGYDRELRLFAVWCARQVQHLMTDPRSIAALEVAERYENGLATDEELQVARAAAYTAYAGATRAAPYAATGAAAYAAAAGANAANAAAYAANSAAAADAAAAAANSAAAAAYAANAVAAAVNAAAYHTAYTKARQDQEDKFREMLNQTT